MGKKRKWLETNELDEVEGLIKDAVVSLEKAVKSVVELREITRARRRSIERSEEGFTGYYKLR